MQGRSDQLRREPTLCSWTRSLTQPQPDCPRDSLAARVGLELHFSPEGFCFSETDPGKLVLMDLSFSSDATVAFALESFGKLLVSLRV